MSAAPNDPHQGLAVDKVSSITSPEASRAREPPSQENPGSDAESGSHSQDSSFSSDGPPTPAPQKDENFADRVDKVPIAHATDAFTAIREPERKGVLVESEDDDEEEEDDDDDDDGFIPRGLPSRPTGSAANAGLRPVKAGR
ncbi:hypothetical protein LXA43DRAFT_1088978 [Ganoderma leucocontextum]|nr:hypothetical protein LXA43DRAFT_1088978 [Ganoderma leucocontextum]